MLPAALCLTLPIVMEAFMLGQQGRLNIRWFSGVFLCTALVGLIFFLGTSIGAEAKTGDAVMVPESFSSLAEMASPAVVNVRTEKTVQGSSRSLRQFHQNPFGNDDRFNDFFEKFFGEQLPKDHKERSLGSGFIIDKDGFIVTNNHVIENADMIKVKMKDGKEFNAEIIGKDPSTDLALIKVPSGNNLPVIAFGDSNNLKVGQWVVAIGSPFGLEQTVTAGILSAKGRVIGSGPYDNFLQTDASINPGNSGGPLIDMQGKVVGINTAIIASGQGIGFAIPINLASGIIEQLKNKGEVTRGWLGVVISDINDDVAEYYGVKDKKGAMVMEVVKGDPADLAGIQANDIILEVNDQKVETSRDLTNIIAGISVGEKVKIQVLRNNKKQTFTVEISKRPEESKLATKTPEKGREDEIGIRVANLTPEIAHRLNLSPSDGVLVERIEPGSKAAEAGVQAGDVIKEINHHAIKSIQDYSSQISKLKKNDVIQIFIWRMNAGFVVVKITK
jgi:serine protease Do